MARTLDELIAARLGVRTRPVLNPETASVGITAVRVLGNNPNRVGFVIVNLSANTLFINPLSTPSSTNGIQVPANGGSVSMNWEEDFHLVGYEWLAIAGAAGSTILVLEEVIY